MFLSVATKLTNNLTRRILLDFITLCCDISTSQVYAVKHIRFLIISSVNATHVGPYGRLSDFQIFKI
jgi:hypothetical protein